MLLIGQSLELSRAALFDAVRAEDASTLLARAQAQVDAGAAAIDINTGIRADVRDVAWCVRVLREAFPALPLLVDASNAQLIAESLEACGRDGVGGPLVANSVAVDMMGAFDTDAPAVLRAAAPLGAGVVISARHADAPGAIADAEYVAYAGLRATERARAEGITGPVYLDALGYPALTDPARCARSLATLRGWRLVDHAEPLVAVGNVGYGTASALTSTLRAAYAAAAIGAGARALVLPVEDEATMRAVGVALGDRAPDGVEDAWLLDVANASREDRAPSAAPPAYVEAARLLFG